MPVTVRGAYSGKVSPAGWTTIAWPAGTAVGDSGVGALWRVVVAARAGLVRVDSGGAQGVVEDPVRVGPVCVADGERVARQAGHVRGGWPDRAHVVTVGLTIQTNGSVLLVDGARQSSGMAPATWRRARSGRTKTTGGRRYSPSPVTPGMSLPGVASGTDCYSYEVQPPSTTYPPPTLIEPAAGAHVDATLPIVLSWESPHKTTPAVWTTNTRSRSSLVV